jgi:hypothetical protein
MSLQLLKSHLNLKDNRAEELEAHLYAFVPKGGVSATRCKQLKHLIQY